MHSLPHRRPNRLLLCITALTCLWATKTFAAENEAPAQKSSDDNDRAYFRSAGNLPTGSLGTFFQEGPVGGIWQREQLLGDMGGLRPYLGSYGIAFSLQETSEILGNVSGGIKQSAAYDGLTTATLQLDTKRAFGWYGGTFNVSALHVHGSNLSASNLANLQTASGIEADNGFRLWEAWYDQAFFYNKMDVKIGQQSLDQEFMNSQYAGLFVNTMFGWPMLPSADLLSGGPAYPLASPGVRVRLQPNGPFSLLAGVFDDNPGGPCEGGDSQLCDRRGTDFRIFDAPLFIAELQYSHPAMSELEYSGKDPALPGTYKLGFWYDTGKYADQHYGRDGLSFADPGSSGDPGLHRGNYSIYAVVDQLLWRENPQSDKGLGFFFRGMVAPQDRNLINMSLNAGFTFREPFEHREDDVFGIGVGYANVSNSASSLDRDMTANGTPTLKRSGETFVEATYQYQLAPWLGLQPDFQYVFNPGGGLINPNDPTGTRKVGNEAIFGLRTNISF